MSTRGRIAFLVSGFPSHIYSTMGLARRFASAGANVEYWGVPAVRRIVRSQGFQHRTLEPILTCYERLIPPEGVRRFRSAVAALRGRRRNLPDDIARFESSLDAILSSGAPDVVVLDPLAAAWFPLLRARDIQCVLLQDKPPPHQDALLPPPTSSYVPRDSLGSRMWVQTLWLARVLGNTTRCGLLQARSQLGIYTTEDLICTVASRCPAQKRPVRRPRGVSYDVYFDGLPEWILTTPVLELPRRDALPEGACHIGTCVDRRRVQLHHSIPRRPSARLVYVSMGLAIPDWRSDVSILRRVITALANLPGVDVLITTGNPRTRTALTCEYPNVHILPFVSQLAVLEDADLAIVHAGANSFRECVATGTPMLAYPREFDQWGNAARILFHGLGLAGRRGADSAATIRRKVLAILEDESFRLRVQRLNVLSQAAEQDLLGAALKSVALDDELVERVRAADQESIQGALTDSDRAVARPLANPLRTR